MTELQLQKTAGIFKLPDDAVTRIVGLLMRDAQNKAFRYPARHLEQMQTLR